MTFYTAALFPKWTGSLFTGALAGRMLVRLSLNGSTVTGEEHLLRNLNERIRDVRQGPDGALWLLTDNSAGRILRVSPAVDVKGALSQRARTFFPPKRGDNHSKGPTAQ